MNTTSNEREPGSLYVNLSGADRIYLIPPYRRGLPMFLMGVLLVGGQRLALVGHEPLEGKKSRMSISELHRRLSPYPVLHSEFLETLTDQEWEDLALGRESSPTNKTPLQKFGERLSNVRRFFPQIRIRP